jgi:hypothetical protein
MGAAQRGGPTAPGSAQPIEAFREDAHAFAPAAFEARHGSAFLLLTATGLAPPKGPAATEVRLLGDDDPAAHTADLAVLVYPLRQRASSAGHLITVGRAPENDVVIADRSVSRFHAFFKRDAGSYRLQDAGSTNGTELNCAPVAARGNGPAAALKRGDTVRFGQLDFTFVDAAGLRAFAIESDG